MPDIPAPVPDMVRSINAVAMAAYAGATWDWTQTHLDADAARAAGFVRPIVDGQMLGAILAAHAQRTAGRRVRVVAMRFRHTGPVLRDDRIRIRTEVLSDDGTTRVIRQDVDVLDEGDTVLRRAIIGAETTVTTEG